MGTHSGPGWLLVTPQMPSNPVLVKQRRDGQRGGWRIGESQPRREALTGCQASALGRGPRLSAPAAPPGAHAQELGPGGEMLA